MFLFHAFNLTATSVLKPQRSGGMTVAPPTPAADWHPGSFAPLPGPCKVGPSKRGSSSVCIVSSIHQVMFNGAIPCNLAWATNKLEIHAIPRQIIAQMANHPNPFLKQVSDNRVKTLTRTIQQSTNRKAIYSSIYSIFSKETYSDYEID